MILGMKAREVLARLNLPTFQSFYGIDHSSRQVLHLGRGGRDHRSRRVMTMVNMAIGNANTKKKS